MPSNKLQPECGEFDLELMKYFMSLSLEEKLNYLEQLNQFLDRTMPQSSKDIWEKLKTEGF